VTLPTSMMGSTTVSSIYDSGPTGHYDSEASPISVMVSRNSRSAP
jgi:hypothetical protein